MSQWPWQDLILGVLFTVLTVGIPLWITFEWPDERKEDQL